MAQTLREKLDARFSALESERSSWEAHWKDISAYIRPRRSRFLTSDTNKGGTHYNKSIVDNTGTLASNNLASGMMAGITSPARPWFRLAPDDPDMVEFAPVRDWLHTVGERMRMVFSQSNIYKALHTLYGELGDFGTAVIHVEQHPDTVIRAYPYTIGSYYLAMNDELVVDTLYRLFPMTVSQLVSKFGREQCSQSVQSMFESGKYDAWVDVYHAIEPRFDREMGREDNRNMPFRSVYWEKGSNSEKTLRESGYMEFPAMAPRWDVTGSDIYGHSPGMMVLGDVKQLQQEQRDKGIGIQKMVKPPMVGPSSLRREAATTLPGGVTYHDTLDGHQGFRPAYQVDPRLADLKEDIIEVQHRIKRGYYEDLFLMLASTNRREITAREIEERHEEKLLMLGPVLERLHDELLDPLIDRTFRIMAENRILPDPPPELEGRELQVEYISIMAQAQKAVGTSGIERLAGFAGNLAAVKPEVLDKIDFDQVVDEYSDMLGTPPDLVVSDEQVAAIRQQRAEQQQQLMQAEQAASMVQGAKTLSETDTRGQNALTDLLGGGLGA